MALATTINKAVVFKASKASKIEVTPEIGSKLFENTDAALYLGVIATPDGIENKELYQAAARLRYNVYVKEKGLMSPSLKARLLRKDFDQDDERSVHFAIAEKRENEKRPRLIGTSRLIVKGHENDDLPVEQMFPEAFQDKAIPENGVEASRFIARHESKLIQHMAARGLIRAMTSYANDYLNQPVYAVADRALMGMFRLDRVPFETLADSKVLDEYSTKNYTAPNYPIAIDTVQLANNALDPDSDLHAMYEDLSKHHGLGYLGYDMLTFEGSKQ